MNNETSNAATAAPSRVKVPTPATDLERAIAAIHARLTTIKSAWKEKNDQPEKEAFYMSCMDKTAASLIQQIESMTEPVDEHLVEEKLDEFEYRFLSLQHEPIIEDDFLSSEDEEVDISFDDAEILDQEAYEKVKELRCKSREIASRVISVREEALERALGVTSRSVSELLRVHGFSEGESVVDEEMTGDSSDRNEDGKRLMDPLHVALRNLTSSLQNVDSGLTEKLESLKETIGTIDASVEKYQRASQGDENALSQMEKALIAASNLKAREVEEIGGEETMDNSTNPDRILARLLAGAL
ncbi:hypothetical protein HJC23_006393 [Cyclotella cryptica]|uniref:Uncharacterized protein n=1 Tax=Cyclotella cryptica TaxID=29204 RepID=A0ABD3Q434_9STRA